MAFSANESIFIVGHSQPEMGGSEYYEYFHRITGGTVPQVDLKVDRQNSCHTEPHKNRPGKLRP